MAKGQTSNFRTSKIFGTPIWIPHSPAPAIFNNGPQFGSGFVAEKGAQT